MPQIPTRVHKLIEPVVTAMGFELVGVEYLAQGRNSLLRVYIDGEDGITVDDCGRVSHQVSGVLDVEDPIRGHYTLEVSSPGLDRPLFTEEQYLRFTGHRVKLRMGMPVAGRRNFAGVLKSVQDGNVVLEVDGGEVSLPLDAVEKANLVPQL